MQKLNSKKSELRISAIFSKPDVTSDAYIKLHLRKERLRGIASIMLLIIFISIMVFGLILAVKEERTEMPTMQTNTETSEAQND